MVIDKLEARNLKIEFLDIVLLNVKLKNINHITILSAKMRKQRVLNRQENTD